MEDIRGRQANDSEEIDLVKIVVGLFNFIRTNFWIFVAFNALSISAGVIYFLRTEKIYSSRFTGECMLLPDGRTIELLKDLDGLRKNEDWALLGRRLGMHPNHVIKIKEILPLPNATIDKESRGTEDYVSQYNPMPFSFSVVVKVTDNSILPELQKGMIRYLSNNPYNSIRVSRFIENRKSLLISINAEIARLDSFFQLDRVIRFKSVSKPETNNEISYKDLLYELHEKKEIIEDELRFALPVRIIQEFTPFKKHIYPVKWQIALVALICANAAALLFIGFRRLMIDYPISGDSK
jgi:hypothetical protein